MSRVIVYASRSRLFRDEKSHILSAMRTKIFWQKDWAIPAGFGLLTYLILLMTNALDSYGIFRDEYYFLACSRHLGIRICFSGDAANSRSSR